MAIVEAVSVLARSMLVSVGDLFELGTFGLFMLGRVLVGVLLELAWVRFMVFVGAFVIRGF